MPTSEVFKDWPLCLSVHLLHLWGLISVHHHSGAGLLICLRSLSVGTEPLPGLHLLLEIPLGHNQLSTTLNSHLQFFGPHRQCTKICTENPQRAILWL